MFASTPFTASSSMEADSSGSSSTSGSSASVPAVKVNHLNFDYGSAGGYKPILKDMSFELPKGSRMLLVGDNGCGKSTLLRVIAGRHIFRDDAVMVTGKHAFYDTSLNHTRAHLAGDWGRRTVAFTGHGCALSADIGVSEMMQDLQSQYKERRDMLASLLGVDLEWRMHQLSDGQRRRVQLMLQLLRPAEVVLLDEITTDLDLITRQDFLTFIKKESEEKGLTVLYATHIFDGLDGWATHLCFISAVSQSIAKFGACDDFPELVKHQKEGVVAPLLKTIEGWLRTEREDKKSKGMKITEEAERAVDELRGPAGNGYLPGRFNNGFN